MQRGANSYARATFAVPALVAGLSTAVATTPVHASARLEDGKVTAQLTGVSLASAVAALARLWGARVEWRSDPPAEEVSADFTSLPAEEALARVLQRHSFFVVYTGTESMPQRIVVLASAGDEGVGRTSGDRTRGQAVVDEQPSTPGVPNAALEAALADEDPDVRLRMVETIAPLEPEDARRQLVLARLVADPDPRVRAAALQVQLMTSRASRQPRRGRGAALID